MKRLLCIILALMMCLSLISCGKEDVQDETETPENTPATDIVTDTGESENTEETEEEPPVDPKTIWNGTLEHRDEVGFYNPEYDYSANPRYKVCVFNNMSTSADELYESAFARWCDLMNVEFGGFIKAEGHIGKAEEQIRGLAAEYDGIILRGDFEFRFSSILNEEGCPWIYWGDEYCDDDGNLLAPVVRFAEFDSGAEIAKFTAQYYEENLSHIPASEVGILYVTYSGMPQVVTWQERYCETMKTVAPELSNNIVILDKSGPYDVSSFDFLYDAALQENPQYKYWICPVRSSNDTDYAVSAFVRNGFADNAYVFTTANIDLYLTDSTMTQVKAGFTTPVELQLEPVIGALYGFITGELSPETIWGGNENGCGCVYVDCNFNVTRENYADYRLKLDAYMS